MTQYSLRSTFDALGPVTTVDWGTFGAAGTTVSTPSSQTFGGLGVGVTSSQGQLQRLDEGNGPGTFRGTFAAGDHLLADAGSQSDSFVVSFAAPVLGFGTQIDAHYLRGSFTGEVDVFSVSNTLLYQADFSGVASSGQNNSAPFVGVRSSTADIGYAEFWVNQSGQQLPSRSGALAINRLDVLVPVPEPAALALLMAGLLGTAAAVRTRRVAQRA